MFAIRSSPLKAMLADRSGTAAIEFGLAIPMLAILLAGIIEVGYSMYQAMQVTYAAEAGLFSAAKNGWNAASIANAAANAASLRGISAKATQFCGCPGATGIAAATCGSTCASGSLASQYIEISVSAPRLSIIGSSSFGLPSTVSAQSILRQN